MAKKSKQIPITREVGRQSKGPRLQRLRAIELILDVAAQSQYVNAFVAVELQGDIFARSCATGPATEYHEENKNYDPSVSFTLASDEVRNALVAFCDCWLDKFCSSLVYFGFYAPNAAAKERATERSTALAINWPSKPVLELLAKRDFDDSNLLAAVKTTVLNEYSEQARQHGHNCNNAPSGVLPRPLANMTRISSWDDVQWKRFLNQITWHLGEDDANTLENRLIQKIQSSSLYNEQLDGRERQIIAALNDLLDKRQVAVDPIERCVHAAEIGRVFQEVQAGTFLLPDPAWKMWANIPKPTDIRNLSDKLQAICPSFPDVGQLSRQASNGLLTQRERADDKSVLAQKYHIYDACDEQLSQMRDQNSSSTMDPSDIHQLIAALVLASKKRMDDRSQDHSYPIRSETGLRDMLLELFDSCYLAFDKK